MAVAAIGLAGCKAKEKEQEATVTSYIEGATEADMSGYNTINSNDCFMEITVDQLLNAISQKDTNAIVYIGYTQCENCQSAIVAIQDAARDLNQTVYYLDTAKSIQSDVDYDRLFDALKPILVSMDKDNPDDIGLYTPHVFKIENGELVQGHVGYTEGYDYTADMTFGKVA